MSSDPTTSIVTADEHDDHQVPDAAARVLGWRLEQLCAAGYDGEAALALAPHVFVRRGELRNAEWVEVDLW